MWEENETGKKIQENTREQNENITDEDKHGLIFANQNQKKLHEEKKDIFKICNDHI